MDIETGGDNLDRVREARKIVFDMGLGQETASMTPGEEEFVLGTEDRLTKYGDATIVSPKQLFWLRDLNEKYL